MTAQPLIFKGHPLRITYVADALNVHTQRWVTHFLKRGCECKVVSYRHGIIPGAEVYVHSLPSRGAWRFPLLKQIHTHSDYSRIRAMLKWSDIVHVHYIYRYRFNILFKGIKHLVVSTWGTDVIPEEGKPRSKGEIFWQKFILKEASIITATSNYLANETAKFAPPNKPIRIIPFGVDLSIFNPDLFPGRMPEDRPFRIGFLKHLRFKYGPDILIEATKLLRNEGLPVRTIIAGEGEDETLLRNRAKELGVAKLVDFVDRIPHEEVPAFMASLDVFCMPSRQESFGVAALEAQAMRLPVVATMVGGIPETVKDGVTGILVRPGDPKALAEAISSLLKNPRLRLQMGEAGRKFVQENFDWNDCTAKMEEVYNSLIQE